VAWQSVTLTSKPAGARVWIDGKPAGNTPVPAFRVAEGDHVVRMLLGDRATEHTVTINQFRPTRYHWTVDGDHWSTRGR